MARSWPRLAAGLTLITALGIGTAAPGAAHGSSGGTTTAAYQADVSPTGIAAGTTTQQTLTVTQRSSSSSLRVGSFQVTVPSALSVTTATAKRGSTSVAVTVGSGTLTVDSTGLTSSGQTVQLTMAVAAPCGTGGDGAWSVTARKASPFASGTGALSQDTASQLGTTIGRCSLRFSEQPESAGRGKVITGVEADPNGAPVAVQLLDGTGSPAAQSGVRIDLDITAGTGASGATLGGDRSDLTGGAGIAVLAPTIDTSARGYELEASASGIIGTGPSGPFDINDVAKRCSGDCSGSSDKGDTTATIQVSSNGGILSMSLGLDSLDCNDAPNHYYTSTSAPVTWDITTGTSRTEVTIRLAAASVNRPFNLYDVCFSSPTSSFRNRYNVKIKAGQSGLLKICPPRLDSEPCVVDKWRDGGDVLVKFSVPAGDPRGRI